MLLTLRHDANRARFIMPAPERMKKVHGSMSPLVWYPCSTEEERLVHTDALPVN